VKNVINAWDIFISFVSILNAVENIGAGIYKYTPLCLNGELLRK